MAIADLLAASEDTVFRLLAEEATYTPTGGSATTIQVMPVSPDEVLAFEQTRLQQDPVVLEVRVSEVASPTKGEAITYDSTLYVIKETPTHPDPRRRIWTIELRPA